MKHTPSHLALQTIDAWQQQARVDFKLPEANLEELESAAETLALASLARGSLKPSHFTDYISSAKNFIQKAFKTPTVSPRQSPMDQHVIDRVDAELRRRVIHISNIDLPKKVILASLPIGQANALTVQLLETEEYIVLFQQGLFGLMNLLARAVASAWPSDDDDQGMKLVATHTELEKKLAKFDLGSYLFEALHHSLILGNPHGMKVYAIPPSQAGMKETLLLNAEIFILGHEYGHIQRAHFEQESRIEMKFGNQALTAASRTHQQEFSADLTGFELASGYGTLKPTEVLLAYYGTCFFLSCQEIIEEALRMLPGVNDGHVARDTHPDPSLRRESISNVLRIHIGHANAEVPINGYAEIHWILTEAWRQAQPRWRELAAAGTTASPIWATAVESQERPAEKTQFTVDPPDKTSQEWGMPSLRDIDDHKGMAFLAFLHIVDPSTEKQLRHDAAVWAEKNAVMIVLSLMSEIAYGDAKRRDSLIKHLLKTCARLDRWLSEMRFLLKRYDGNHDLLGVPEVLLCFRGWSMFVQSIAEQIRCGDEPDYEWLLQRAEAKNHSASFGRAETTSKGRTAIPPA